MQPLPHPYQFFAHIVSQPQGVSDNHFHSAEQLILAFYIDGDDRCVILSAIMDVPGSKRAIWPDLTRRPSGNMPNNFPSRNIRKACRIAARVSLAAPDRKGFYSFEKKRAILFLKSSILPIQKICLLKTTQINSGSHMLI